MARRRTHREQPARCSCMPGRDSAREHGRPGAKAADHGDPFRHKKGCVHSELQHTTKPKARAITVNRLRLQ